jgi:hypothetical protein
MKYIHIILLILVIFLSSCFGPFSSDETETQEWENTQSTIKSFETDSLILTIPNSWEELSASSLPAPKTGEVFLALKSKDLSDWVYRTLVILEDTIIWKLTSKQYARNDYRVSIKNYAGYRELEEKQIEFADGDESLLFHFEAKYNPDSPRMKFLQSSKICSDDTVNMVYNITISLPNSIEDLAKYESLIKSMQCPN